VDKHPRARLLLLGAGGQVGWELTRALAPLGAVLAHDRSTVDLSDLDGTRAAIRSAKPDIIVNSAAYTDVERAESETSLARRINGEAPKMLAEEASRAGALLVHYSTDYVFDGEGSRAYVEDDPTGPVNAYGRSKLDGDRAVLESDAEAYIFRVGWVYGQRGRNFLATIERLARERNELRVVADQYGSPTWSHAIAAATAEAISQWLAARRASSKAPARGVYHMAAPDFATWYDFATTIVASMPAAEGWTRPVVVPIRTTEYRTAAPRPAWSVLDSSRLFETFGIALQGWRTQFVSCRDRRT
jgi:dTDP-4-dehydrorhamnose reductase